MTDPQGAGSRRSPAPRGGLDRDLILRTAVKVMADDGLGAVTIRRVAGDLNVRPMALYTHFQGKDDLLRAIFDDLVADVELPRRGEDDLAALRRMAREYLHVLVGHPGLIPAALSSARPGVNGTRIGEVFLGICLGHGLPEDEAYKTVATLSRYIFGAAAHYPGQQALNDPAHQARVLRSLREIPSTELPHMRRIGDLASVATEDDLFEFGLDLLLRRLTGGGA